MDTFDEVQNKLVSAVLLTR